MKSLLYFFKFVLEVLSLSAWVKYQMVKLSSGQKFCGMCRNPNGFKIKFFFFRKWKYIFPNSLYFSIFLNSLQSREIGIFEVPSLIY